MEPNFAEIYDDCDVEMIQDAYDTIHRLGLWNWFAEFRPHPNEGFMFTSDITIAMIGKEMKFYDSHSGASFGITMSIVHDIAKNGWENHKNADIKIHGDACPCRRARGKVTRWCGRASGGVPECQH